MQKHNNTIDFLRFFAALMVVFFHLNQAVAPVDNWFRNTVKFGFLGVPIFFVISGYCITLSGYNSANVKDFLSRRFFRIYPAYWVSLAVVLAAACIQKVYIGSNAVHNLPKSVVAIAATVSLTTAPLSKIGTINWVYWSLTCELFFYLIVGVILYVSKTRMIYCTLVVSVFPAILAVQHSGLLFLLDQWPAFGLGVSVFYFVNAKEKTSWLLACCLCSLNIFGLIQKTADRPGYVYVSLAAFVLVLGSNYIRLPKNIFSNMGKYSYSVYLIHVPVGVFILGLFQVEAVEHNPFLNLIHDCFIYGCISILAWVMFDRVEQPAIEFGRKFSQKYFNSKSQKHSG